MIVRDITGAGHESAGEIIDVGPDVVRWKKGDRVAIEAGIPCGACEFCLSGRYNACERLSDSTERTVFFFANIKSRLLQAKTWSSSPRRHILAHCLAFTCIRRTGSTVCPIQCHLKKGHCVNRLLWH